MARIRAQEGGFGPAGFLAPDDMEMFERSQAGMAAAPIQTTRLTDALSMLSGPGGNVVVLNGPDGKVSQKDLDAVITKFEQHFDAGSKSEQARIV